jgi:transcriptional regulator with XRE-family HTH domain
MNSVKSELNTKICLRIKFERIKRNLSQEQLAELAELNRNTIGNIERGIASPTVNTLEKLAKAFNMGVLELIDVSNITL